jgi:hypothetical protein
MLELFMTDAEQAPSAAVADPQAARVHWDQAQMRTEFANVINVLSTREEFSLLFGLNSTWALGEARSFEVKLSNRIVLTPFAAKRLSVLLNERVAEYEAKNGELNISA